jgi:hypothetical protein
MHTLPIDDPLWLHFKPEEMLKNPRFRATLQRKIPALSGREAKTNVAICEKLSLEGARTIWQVNKLLGRTNLQYPTIFRAMNRLEKTGYVAKVGSQKMQKKKALTPTYGTTWRGFIAALSRSAVRDNIITVLAKQKWLADQFDPFGPTEEDLVEFIDSIIDREHVKEITEAIFVNLVRLIPNDVESILTSEYFYEYVFPSLLERAAFGLDFPLKAKEELYSYIVRHPRLLEYIEEKMFKPQVERVKHDQEVLEKMGKWLEEAKTRAGEAKR